MNLRYTNHSQIGRKAGLSPEYLFIERANISGRVGAKAAPADASAERTAGTITRERLRVGAWKQDYIRNELTSFPCVRVATDPLRGHWRNVDERFIPMVGRLRRLVDWLGKKEAPSVHGLVGQLAILVS